MLLAVRLSRRSYANRTGKMRPLTEAIRPLVPFTSLFVLTTVWVLLSRNGILEMEPRMLFVLYGTIFSNICVSAPRNEPTVDLMR